LPKYFSGFYPTGSAAPYEKMKQREWDIRLACQKLQELEIETQQVLAIERNNQIQGSFASFPTPQLLKVRSFRSAQFVQLFIKFVPFRQTNSLWFKGGQCIFYRCLYQTLPANCLWTYGIMVRYRQFV